MPNDNIEVPLDTIRTVLEFIRQEHGIQINSINFHWLDVSTHADPNRAICNLIDMCSTSRVKNPEA